MKEIVIWGAGREGRGYLADLFATHARITFVDTDRELVARLAQRGAFTLHQFPGTAPAYRKVLSGYRALHTGDPEIPRLLARADAVMLCVYLEDMEAAAAVIAGGLELRRRQNPGAPLDLFVCANAIRYAPALRRLFLDRLPAGAHDWFGRAVGVVETLLRRTCVDPAPGLLREDPLCVFTNDFPLLLADAGAVKNAYPEIPGLRFSGQMHMEEIRKIYTYNLLHAVYAYLGNPRGYTYVAQCRQDPAIQAVAERAYRQSSAALRARYGISGEDERDYQALMWQYVVTPAMRDQVRRVGFDPIRKLAPGERLAGPARLCLEEGIFPDAIVTAMAHAFLYDVPEDPFSQRLLALVRREGIRGAVASCCGLRDCPALADAVCQCYESLPRIPARRG